MWHAYKQLCLFHEGRYEDFIQWSERAINGLSNTLPAAHRPIAASFAMLGHMEEARAAMAEFKSQVPAESAATTRLFLFKDPAASECYVVALLKAEAHA
ncbi:MAG: hypothetical protein VCE75_22310 [Alphaproteobacteria bacterium]